MVAKGRRATSRRTPVAGNGVAGRRIMAAGILTAPKLFRHKATTLRMVNAPNVLSFKKRLGATRVGEIHGFRTVNAPGSGRKSVNVSPTVHGINTPRGRY